MYHYLQKDLLVTDIRLFEMLLARLIASLGIWMSPRVYQRMPLLVPFAVRDPSCRGNPAKGVADQWGTPNADGIFRDDNTLVKNIPKSLAIVSERNSYYANGFMAKGFVASHVWRKLHSATLASRERWTYSFVPNLVWLPTQVAKLSDREASFVQTYLQALSLKIYREVTVHDSLRPMVESAWQLLPVRAGIPPQGLPDVASMNFFEPETSWFDRRIKTVRSVVNGLDLVASGQPLPDKIISSRYTTGLPSVAPENVQILRQVLVEYLTAVEARA